MRKKQIIRYILLFMLINIFFIDNTDYVRAGGGWEAPEGIAWDESEPLRMVVKWNAVNMGDMEAYYEVGIFMKDELLETMFCRGTSTDVKPEIEGRDSGTYIIRVRTIDKFDSMFNSDWSTQYLEYKYQKPEKELEVPTGVVWNGKSICWEEVEGADGYCVQLYDGADLVVEIRDTFANCACDFSEYMKKEKAFYKVKVQAVSKDINTIVSSEFSKKSEKYEEQAVAEKEIQAEKNVTVKNTGLEMKIKTGLKSIFMIVRQLFSVQN